MEKSSVSHDTLEITLICWFVINKLLYYFKFFWEPCLFLDQIIFDE